MTSNPSKLVPCSQVVSTFLVGSENGALYTLTDRIGRADRNIPLDDALQLSEQDPIFTNRGKAIQAYAILEQSLCHLLGELSGVTLSVAATIFYRIVNTGSRSGILERLLNKRHGTTFNRFWSQYFKDLRQLDLRRNAIVHWLTAMNVALNINNEMIVGLNSIPPGSLGGGPPSEYILSTDMIEFSERCLVYARLCSMFCLTTTTAENPMDEDLKQTWLGIFQQPLAYPLPANHPLNQTSAKPGSQPQSSPT